VRRGAILAHTGGDGVLGDDVVDRACGERLGIADWRRLKLTNSASVAAAGRAVYHLLSASCA
jgi:hypothetical protein